jgi:hypothetical protein
MMSAFVKSAVRPSAFADEQHAFRQTRGEGFGDARDDFVQFVSFRQFDCREISGDFVEHRFFIFLILTREFGDGDLFGRAQIGFEAQRFDFELLATLQPHELAERRAGFGAQ